MRKKAKLSWLWKGLKKLWWLPFYIEPEGTKFNIPLPMSMLKTFEEKRARFWKSVKQIFMEKILPGTAVGVAVSAATAAFKGIAGMLAARKLEKMYMNATELADIPAETKREALQILFRVAPTLSIYPGIVIPFVKQYHLTERQIPLPTLEALSTVEKTISQYEAAPSTFRRSIESLKAVTELSKMLETEARRGRRKKKAEVKEAEFIGGLIGMLIGLLFARYIPSALKEKAFPLLAGIGGFSIGSLLEHRARQHMPQIIYPHRHPHQIPTFPYTL